MDEQRKKLLEDIRNTPYAGFLKEYFNEQIAEMGNLITIQGTPEEKGITVQARVEAAKILKGILYFLEEKKGKGRPKKSQYI